MVDGIKPHKHAPSFLQGGQNMVRRPASLGPFGKRQLFLCQGWNGTSPVVGTFDGHIYRHVVNCISSDIATKWLRIFSKVETIPLSK